MGPATAPARSGSRIHVTGEGEAQTALTDIQVAMRRFIFPVDSNSRATAHTGNLRKWMVQLGGLSSMHFAGTDTVTAEVDCAGFHRPIPDGQVALVDSNEYEAGTSSAGLASAASSRPVTHASGVSRVTRSQLASGWTRTARSPRCRHSR